MTISKRTREDIGKIVASFNGRSFTTYEVYEKLPKNKLTPSIQQLSAYLRQIAVSVDSVPCSTYYNGNVKSQVTKVNRWCAL